MRKKLTCSILARPLTKRHLEMRIEDRPISILDPFGQAQGRFPFSIFGRRPINICNHSARIPTLSPNDLATKATPNVSSTMKITVMLATSR